MVKLNEILIFGTHDSGTYKIDYTKKLHKTILNPLTRINCVRNIVDKWAICQKYNIFTQLSKNARYLDLRVSKYEKDKTYYTCHEMCCAPLEEVLDDVVKFMETCKKAIIVIEITEKFNVVEDELKTLIFSKLSKYLHKNKYNGQFYMDVDDMIKNDERIVLYYPFNQSSPYSTNFWNSLNIIGDWINTNNATIKNEESKKQITAYEKTDTTLLHVAYTLSPQPKDISKDIFSNIYESIFPCCKKIKRYHSLYDMEKTYNETFKEFFNSLNDNERKKINIITFDFYGVYNVV